MPYIPSLTLPSLIFSTPAASILLPVALGTAIGSTARPKDTYKAYLSLKQPPGRLPPWVYGPVWTVLYGVMGYSAYRAWTTGDAHWDPRVRDLTRQGATLYTVQLGLNLVWMPVFFTLKRPVEATAIAAGIWGAAGYLTYIWGQVDRLAGWALVPYFGWLTYSMYLSVGVGYLNDWEFNDREPPKRSKDTKAQ